MLRGIIRIWKVSIKANDEFSIPAADSIVYNGIMFITTGIMKRPKITLIIKFFALNSNLANAYPPNALTVTLKIVLPILTTKLLIRLCTKPGSVNTNL
jgi:hypothetical protein